MLGSPDPGPVPDKTPEACIDIEDSCLHRRSSFSMEAK